MTVPAAPAPSGGHSQRALLVLAVCSMSVFLTGLDSTIVTIALPTIGRSRFRRATARLAARS